MARWYAFGIGSRVPEADVLLDCADMARRAEEKQVRPHRCNPFAEDLAHGLFTTPREVMGPLRKLFACLTSEAGCDAARAICFAVLTGVSGPGRSRRATFSGMAHRPSRATVAWLRTTSCEIVQMPTAPFPRRPPRPMPPARAPILHDNEGSHAD